MDVRNAILNHIRDIDEVIRMCKDNRWYEHLISAQKAKSEALLALAKITVG
jgi:hypothetical protein